MTRNGQRGSAMLVTMILMAALLAGAAVLVSLQLGANRNTDMTKTGITALYCAEAGLAATRATIAENQGNWGAALLAGTEPSWLSGVSHDVDGNPANDPDFEIRLEDNFDEQPPTADDPNADLDGKIYIVSKCRIYPDTPREVRELITFALITNCYNSQRGGCGGNGNMNR